MPDRDDPAGKENDEAAKSPESPEPPAARVGARYSAIVGVLFIAFLVVAGINTLGTEEGGVLGLKNEGEGRQVRQFAVPEASGPLEGDANITQTACAVSERPCPPEHRQTPACEVRGPEVIRVCDLYERPLVISFWFTRGGDCEIQQDVVSRVAERYRGRVNFLSLDIRDERPAVRKLIRERGWTMPIGHDADGAVANLYKVGGCPTFAYIEPGGKLRDATIGELADGELIARVDQLITASRQRNPSEDPGVRIDPSQR